MCISTIAGHIILSCWSDSLEDRPRQQRLRLRLSSHKQIADRYFGKKSTGGSWIHTLYRYIPVYTGTRCKDNRIATVSREKPKTNLQRMGIKVQSSVNLKRVNIITIEGTNETTSDARDSTETHATNNKQRCP